MEYFSTHTPYIQLALLDSILEKSQFINCCVLGLEFDLDELPRCLKEVDEKTQDIYNSLRALRYTVLVSNGDVQPLDLPY